MKFKLFLLLTGLACLPLQATEVAAPDFLAGLRKEHPRLIITTAGWNDLRTRRASDAKLDAVVTGIVDSARKVLKAPTLVYTKIGSKMLPVSREAMRRIELCSFAYRITGEKVFLDRAQKDMLVAAAFVDWVPSVYLCTAEMTTALALGYDWLFDALPATTRATLKQAILEKGIKPGLPSTNTWQKAAMNWNQVCFGGLTIGALAIADENPEIAREVLTLARKNIANGLKPYVPDGIYPEGPGYWSYGTTYSVLMVSALETALGTNWDLPAATGFLASATSLVQQIGPTGRPFNFSDSGDGVQFEPTLFWFAQKLHSPELVCLQNQLLQAHLAKSDKEKNPDRFYPFLAIWINGLPKNIPPPARLPLAWHGDGPNPVGAFRSSWTDTNALFLAFKGGSTKINHSHMDAGSFVLDVNGVRWASDLGAQNYYSIMSKGWVLFDNKQNSDRWRVFRLNNFSHNNLTLGGKLHNATGDARITEFSDTSATVNLSEIFAGQAGNVKRKFSMAGNKTVLIRDDIAAAQPGLSVRWQMLTRAKISVNNNQATLQQDDQTLTVKILSPANARFEIASAQPPQDGVNQPNPNAQILAMNAAVPASGNLTVEIQLQPEAAGAGK